MGIFSRKREVVVDEGDYMNPDGTSDPDRWYATKPKEPGNWKFQGSRWAKGSVGHEPARWIDEPKSRWS